MSEFKYACPVCGQHIKCDSSQGGTVMECPTCFQKIIAPHAPESDDRKFIITGTKIGDRPAAPAAPVVEKPAAPELEKKIPLGLVVFAVVVFAAIAMAIALWGEIFKSGNNQSNGQTSHVSSGPNEKKTPAAPAHKPFGGQASVVFAKGYSIALEPGTAVDEVKSPTRAAFFAAFKADLAHQRHLKGRMSYPSSREPCHSGCHRRDPMASLISGRIGY